jgi:LytR cell envelope-related transcriptional attenuator
MARKAALGPRLATGGLAALVVALVASWAWAQFFARDGAPRQGPAGRVIRVQVLNGSGEEGAASRTASFLRSGGYHVVEVRNADRFDYFATLVVARTEDPAPAREVAHYLGKPPVVRQAWNSDLAEVTVVIGRDRSQLRLQ